jgi:hypothetical protein
LLEVDEMVEIESQVTRDCEFEFDITTPIDPSTPKIIRVVEYKTPSFAREFGKMAEFDTATSRVADIWCLVRHLKTEKILESPFCSFLSVYVSNPREGGGGPSKDSSDVCEHTFSLLVLGERAVSIVISSAPISHISSL